MIKKHKLPIVGGEFFDIFFAADTVLLSTKEASRFLGITPNALRILVCRGQVRFFKIGTRLKFSKSDLLNLLKKGT